MTAATTENVQRLRAQLERAEGRRMDAPVFPAPPALSAILPGGGLRAGASYSLAPSGALLLSLLARPSRAGSWCAAVGIPYLGIEAAEHAGVDLDRLVLIPDPGPRWLAVVATLADVLPVVAVRPPARVSDGDAARLAARLREKGTVLLVQGAWPQSEATLDVSDPQWSGLGAGHGLLEERALTVTVHSRRTAVPRRARILLPDAQGEVAAASVSVGSYRAAMRAVG
ncbi:hypothetical protein FHX48_000724 [Microbacterium halimionae]|uniref:Protein ImuA n=1 Tax=Microbacterium halimionae TaxID=1526413 RepID=A0A7W3JMM7_9MICO|nr:hypothetical protein [Microbacterium halimionae]MBA8815672.1 hypothetical protein [Microbacterium halimionae]NII95718.1 hypothetical protein [Microbacterium halimionae]